MKANPLRGKLFYGESRKELQVEVIEGLLASGRPVRAEILFDNQYTIVAEFNSAIGWHLATQDKSWKLNFYFVSAKDLTGKDVEDHSLFSENKCVLVEKVKIRSIKIRLGNFWFAPFFEGIAATITVANGDEVYEVANDVELLSKYFLHFRVCWYQETCGRLEILQIEAPSVDDESCSLTLYNNTTEMVLRPPARALYSFVLGSFEIKVRTPTGPITQSFVCVK